MKVDRKLGSSTKQGRRVEKWQTHLRTNRTIKRLNMYKNKIKRSKETGEIVRGSVMKTSDKIPKGSMARIQPDRRWFGNTKVIGQTVLANFREELKAKFHDPYSVILKPSKLPLTLLEAKDHDETCIRNKLDWEGPYGPKKPRLRPKLPALDYEALRCAAEKKSDTYDQEGTKDQQTEAALERKAMEPVDRLPEAIFRKGQSHRIWNELYKVIDSSDVILEVLDARDPMGTRSRILENYLAKEKKFKHLIFILNKCDLVPTWATSRWVALLSREHPTLPFHASITNPFGKGNLIRLIRQFGHLHRSCNKDFTCVGLIGYPNVGKSSIINTLLRKKVCNAAPIPGYTKVWQYVRISKSIFMIDCPGVIHQHDEANDTTQAVLKGVVRVERISREDKADFVEVILKLVDPKKLEDTYDVHGWTDHNDFLDKLAERRGKLLKGGLPNRDSVARTVLYDWQRAKIPWFVPPPFESEAEKAIHRKLPKSEHVRAIEKLVSQRLYDPERDREERIKMRMQAAAASDDPALARESGLPPAAQDMVVDEEDEDAEDPELPLYRPRAAEQKAQSWEEKASRVSGPAEFEPGVARGKKAGSKTKKKRSRSAADTVDWNDLQG
eukprot:RCo050218